jgi:hypothetical protein
MSSSSNLLEEGDLQDLDERSARTATRTDFMGRLQADPIPTAGLQGTLICVVKPNSQIIDQVAYRKQQYRHGIVLSGTDRI